MSDDFLNSLEKLSSLFREAMEESEKESETFWTSLTHDQQLQAFCAVVRRIYQGEVVDKGSYRHVLYTTFNFGQEAYALAQYAGYLTIHNALVTDRISIDETDKNR